MISFATKKSDTATLDAVLARIEKRAGHRSLEYLQRAFFVLPNETEYPIRMEHSEWKQKLGTFRFRVLRKKTTERPFTGELNKETRRGTFHSAATGEALFASEDKYVSGTGWPSFTKPIHPHSVRYVIDKSIGATRIEVIDVKSGSHLGHVFEDGPPPIGLRYCINSAALVFVPERAESPSR